MKLRYRLFVFFIAIVTVACDTDGDLQGPLELPTLEFSANKTETVDGEIIQFKDLSENALGWEWDFGDGSEKSLEQNPTHAYVYGGEYSVTLTAWNNDGENVLTKENYIRIDGPEKEKPSLPELFSYTVVTTADHEIKGLPQFVGEIYVNDELFTEVTSATSEMTIPASYFSGSQDVIFYKGEWEDDERVLSIGDNSNENTDIVALNYVADIKAFFGRKLTALVDINEDFFADSPELTNLNGAFRNCTGLETIPAGLFRNNPEITNFQHVFADCKFEVIPEGLFDNNAKVTTFSSAFNVNTVMKEVPAGLFDNCPLVTDFSYAFYKNSNLATIPSGLFDNNPEVTTFEGVFAACALTRIPENFFKNNTKVTNFKSVFNLNTGITEVPDDLFDNSPDISDLSYAFYGCTGLTSAPALWEKTFESLTSTDGCFRGCDQVSNWNEIPDAWK